jgi:hypothetical protein
MAYAALAVTNATRENGSRKTDAASALRMFAAISADIVRQAPLSFLPTSPRGGAPASASA